MKWGPHLQFLISSAEEDGVPPPALRDRPELPADLQEVTLAFKYLTNSRSMGFSPNPISLSDIVSYCKLFGKPSDIEEFVELLQVMDMEYLSATVSSQSGTTLPGG